MIVGIAEIHLQRIVINVAYGNVRFDLRNPEGFKLEPCHRARGVLGQSLIDVQADFASGGHGAGNQMLGDDFLGEVHVLSFRVERVEAAGRAAEKTLGAKKSNLPG